MRLRIVMMSNDGCYECFEGLLVIGAKEMILKMTTKKWGMSWSLMER